MRAGRCDDASQGPFSDTLDLGVLQTPVALCLAQAAPGGPDPAAAGRFDVTLESFDLGTATLLGPGPERRPIVVPFAGGLPPSIDSTASQTGSAHRLEITVTDGNTLPVTAATGFDYHGELRMFIAGGDTPPRAVLAAPDVSECSGPAGATVTLDGS